MRGQKMRGRCNALSREQRQSRQRADRELSYVTASAPRCPERRDTTWYDLTSGRKKPYGNLFWYIDRLLSVNAPDDKVDLIPEIVRAYIVERRAEAHSSRRFS